MGSEEEGETTEKERGKFTLLLFASASTYAGGQETLKLPAPTTIKELFVTLENKFPGMFQKVLSSSAVTVNLDYVDLDVVDTDDVRLEDLSEEDHQKNDTDGNEDQARGRRGLNMKIREGDEVGIIPPVSSG